MLSQLIRLDPDDDILVSKNLRSCIDYENKPLFAKYHFMTDGKTFLSYLIQLLYSYVPSLPEYHLRSDRGSSSHYWSYK